MTFRNVKYSSTDVCTDMGVHDVKLCSISENEFVIFASCVHSSGYDDLVSWTLYTLDGYLYFRYSQYFSPSSREPRLIEVNAVIASS